MSKLNHILATLFQDTIYLDKSIEFDMALVDEKFDSMNELYASLFGDESDDERAEDIIEKVFGKSDDDMEELKVEEIKIPSKFEKGQQVYNDFSESKLEAAAAKLREKYQNLDKGN